MQAVVLCWHTYGSFVRSKVKSIALCFTSWITVMSTNLLSAVCFTNFSFPGYHDLLEVMLPQLMPTLNYLPKLYILTSDFADSGLLAALMMAVLFFWHTQHRSLTGFMILICGVSCLQSEVKVGYAVA